MLAWSAARTSAESAGSFGRGSPRTAGTTHVGPGIAQTLASIPRQAEPLEPGLPEPREPFEPLQRAFSRRLGCTKRRAAIVVLVVIGTRREAGSNASKVRSSGLRRSSKDNL